MSDGLHPEKRPYYSILEDQLAEANAKIAQLEQERDQYVELKAEKERLRAKVEKWKESFTAKLSMLDHAIQSRSHGKQAGVQKFGNWVRRELANRFRQLDELAAILNEKGAE